MRFNRTILWSFCRHFPEILKSHSSHDVVLLCAGCHKKSGAFDQQYKEHFALLCNAPYKTGGLTVDAELKKVKSAARTLNGYADRIPAEKLAECRKTLCDFYGTSEITGDVLETACNIDDRSVCVCVSVPCRVLLSLVAGYMLTTACALTRYLP